MDFRLETRRYSDAQVQELVAAVQQEYVARYGGPDETRVAAGEFEPPHGLFTIGLLDGAAAAMGGWRRLGLANDPDVVEIKRMFVVPSARRLGLARRVLAELEDTAAEAGARQVVLNTGTAQPEAVALYESSGYAPVDGYGHYAGYPKALFYGKALTAHVPVRRSD